MMDFDQYEKLYCGDFNSKSTNLFETTIPRNKLLQEQCIRLENDIRKLSVFMEIWKDCYETFCRKFNCHTWTAQAMPIWSTESSDILHVSLPKSELYIDSFFNMIINKTARFEIQQYKEPYDVQPDKYPYYTSLPDQNILISGKTFIVSGKDNRYQLDTKINNALICSLIVALSNNYIIYDWYSKQSKFKKFIDYIAKSHYFIRFSIDDNINRVHIGGGTKDPLTIDIDRNWLYLVISDETLRVENKLHYNHLDGLFGKDRKDPLTEEDIQLYSIANGGRKPLMFDFEF